MNEHEVFLKVVDILEEIGGIRVEDTSKTLVDDLAMDSFRLVTLLVMIEDAFEIELEESDMDPFRLVSVKDVIDLVSEYVRRSSRYQPLV